MERPEIPTTAILALALAACTGEVDKMSYSVGATDQSGGESVRVTLS